jgi:CubicO group peptidase (beta-lactamase class C family)
VVHDQDVLFTAGFGCADLARQIPATPETLFDTGSLTTVFTGVMLMQLRDAGAVGLDDPIDQYVPAAQYLSPEGQFASPTFRQLATHSSGLERNMQPTPSTIDELFSRLAGEQASFDPGGGYLYSNLGYAVLGQVLARVANEPYEQYLNERVLQPLGMFDSGFGPAPAMVSRMATGYGSVSPTQQIVNSPGSPLPFGGVIDPAGGLITCANDMARFLTLLTRSNDRVLAGSSIAETFQPYVLATDDSGVAAANGMAVGIGWFSFATDAAPRVVKAGATSGFSAEMDYLPFSKVAVVVLVNQGLEAEGNQPVSAALAKLVLDRLAPVIGTNSQ